MTGILIRRATLHDLPEIAGMERDIFGADAWSDLNIREELTGPYRAYYVLEKDGRVAGYGGILVIGDDGDIQTVALDAALRGQGLGKQLVTRLIREARERGARRLFLEVRSDNPVAIGIYTAAGFQVIGRRKNYYRQSGVDAISMKLDLKDEEQGA